jgi:hypothetical protein
MASAAVISVLLDSDSSRQELRAVSMPDLSTADYERSHREFMRLAAEDFRYSASSEQEQRAAICRYLRRGGAAGYSTGELVDFLGVSSPSVLDLAGYSDEAALRVMEVLADIEDEEIQSTTL